VTDGNDAQFLEVVDRQFRQDIGTHGVVSERLFVFLQSELLKPSADVHVRAPKGQTDPRRAD
jgi:hypothetical protein